MFKIEIKNIEVYAYHGVLPEENIIGATYQIDVAVWTNAEMAAKTDEVKNTISYADLNAIILEEMKIQAKLLEHLCYRIACKIHEEFSSIQKIELTVRKLAPPMPGKMDYAAVTYIKNF